MNNYFDLNIYLNGMKSIQNELSSNILEGTINKLENYFEQINSIDKSILFQENFELDKDELKRKLLFKINNNLNENMELVSLKL
jgi:hypothetical protein